MIASLLLLIGKVFLVMVGCFAAILGIQIAVTDKDKGGW